LDQAAGIGPAWLRSERSWDASNPHLNNLAGRLGVAPSFPALETGTSLRGSPRICGEQTIRRPCPEGTQRFPAVCSTLTALLSRLVDGSVVETHAQMDTHCFRGRSSAPAGLPSRLWRMRCESNAHTPKGFAGFKPVEHATCAHPRWRKAVRTMHTPCGCDSLSRRS